MLIIAYHAVSGFAGQVENIVELVHSGGTAAIQQVCNAEVSESS